MPRFVATWTEVALDQYLVLTSAQQQLIDARVRDLADYPDAAGCRFDSRSDTWTATDTDAAGLIVYTFRTSGWRLVILRLIYP